MKPLDEHLCGHAEGDSFGRRMRESRAHAGITRADAAKRIGLSSSQLGRIERGHVTMCDQPITLVSAGRVYGVSNLWLYAGAAAGAKFVPDWYDTPKLELAA